MALLHHWGEAEDETDELELRRPLARHFVGWRGAVAVSAPLRETAALLVQVTRFAGWCGVAVAKSTPLQQLGSFCEAAELTLNGEKRRLLRLAAFWAGGRAEEHVVALASVPAAAQSSSGKLLELSPGSGFVLTQESEKSCRVVFVLGLKRQGEVRDLVSTVLRQLRDAKALVERKTTAPNEIDLPDEIIL